MDANNQSAFQTEMDEYGRTLRMMTSYADILSVATNKRCFGDDVEYTSRTLPLFNRVSPGKSVVVSASAIVIQRKQKIAVAMQHGRLQSLPRRHWATCLFLLLTVALNGFDTK